MVLYDVRPDHYGYLCANSAYKQTASNASFQGAGRQVRPFRAGGQHPVLVNSPKSPIVSWGTTMAWKYSVRWSTCVKPCSVRRTGLRSPVPELKASYGVFVSWLQKVDWLALTRSGPYIFWWWFGIFVGRGCGPGSLSALCN